MLSGDVPHDAQDRRRHRMSLRLFRILAVGSLLLVLAALQGPGLMRGLLPVISEVVPWLDDRFIVKALVVESSTQDTVIRITANLSRAVEVGGHITFPHPEGWLRASTTVGSMLQSAVLMLAVALGWPDTWRARLRVLVPALLLVAVWVLANTALTLTAYLWQPFQDHYAPHGWSMLLTVQQFMHQGGRTALALVAGLGLALLARPAGARP